MAAGHDGLGGEFHSNGGGGNRLLFTDSADEIMASRAQQHSN